jgi:YidC/Oxa1 family membrane protein insertase
MKRVRFSILAAGCFAAVCAGAAAPAAAAAGGFDFSSIGVYPAEHSFVKLGSTDPATGFKFELQLNSRGAAIERAVLSEYNDLDYKDPQPLVVLSAVGRGGGELLSMANGGLELGCGQAYPLPLDRLDWRLGAKTGTEDGSESVTFEAVIQDANNRDAVRLTKSYTVSRDSYHLRCVLGVENLSAVKLRPWLFIRGPVGIGREGVRADLRKVMGAFVDTQGRLHTTRLDVRRLQKARDAAARRLVYKDASAQFIWAAITNKYFTAILRPLPQAGQEEPGWVLDKVAEYYDPDNQPNSGDETVGFYLTAGGTELGPAGEPDSSGTFGFELYIGPKDKSLFERSDLYRSLGYVQTIDFQACCTFGWVDWLAFSILGLMKWMHGFVPNYGVIIIILVLVVRLLLHPVTRSSQVSMMKMSRLGPQAEQIKKQYTNNRQEMNRRLMELYKQQGTSPIMGCLPMLLQMPIWIALYSAIYASIDLRGASFLPFWITDLSAPDALVRFSTVTVPLLGWRLSSFNLLPILLAVAMFLQQKLSPQQVSGAANPQLVQQQKMMLWMMPAMMLVFLYQAPSGLNLYIMASTFAGVWEQYVIRKHIQQKQAEESQATVLVTSKTGGKAKKKKPKPFFRY